MADVTFTITIPSAVVTDFIQAYCDWYGYVDLATSGTRAAFAREHARQAVVEPYRIWRQTHAEKAALSAIVLPDPGITAT